MENEKLKQTMKKLEKDEEEIKEIKKMLKDISEISYEEKMNLIRAQMKESEYTSEDDSEDKSKTKMIKIEIKDISLN